MDEIQKMNKLKKKADVAAKRLNSARARLPKRRRLRIVREFNPEIGKARRRLRIVKEIRPPNAMTLSRAVTTTAGITTGIARGYIHNKIREVEHENVGVEAAHKGEQIAEWTASCTIRSIGRHVRTAPYRRVAKAEKSVVKAESKYVYRKTIYENPAMQKNIIQKAMQKRRIRKQYIAGMRDAQNTAQFVSRTGSKLARFFAQVIGPRRKAALYLTLGIGGFLLISSCASVAGTFATGIFGAVADRTYTASDSEITGGSTEWTKWEYELQQAIGNAKTDHPGFSEYKYELGEIGHNPYEIIAFLSAMYGDFVYADVSDMLWDVFNGVYFFEFIEDGSTLTVKLTVTDFSEVVEPILKNAGALEKYQSYMKSLGGRQRYGNPLGFPWYAYITSLFGQRDNPFGVSGKPEMHLALDISAPLGHPIYSVHEGLVAEAVHGDSIYGNYIIVEDAANRRVKYAHCSVLLVKVGDFVKKGDQIAEVGSTGRSSGPHLHIEIIENGESLNPLFLLDYN